MDNKKMMCWFLSQVFDDINNISYFVGANVKGLFEWNHDTNIIRMISSLEECSYDNELYDVGAISGGKVFFPPKNTDKMLVYDIENGTVEFIELYSDAVKKNIKFRPYYYGHIAYKDNRGNLYFFYREYPIVTIYRKNGSKDVVSFDIGDEIIIEKKFYAEEGVLFFPIANANSVLMFDTNNEKFDIIKFNYSGVGISSCICIEKTLIALTNDAKGIFIYDIEEKTVKDVAISIGDIDRDDLWQIIKREKDYLLIPMLDIKKTVRMDSIYVLDDNFNIVRKVSINAEYSKMKKWSVDSIDGKEWYFLFEPVYQDDGDMFWPQNMQLVTLDYSALEFAKKDFPIPSGFDQEGISNEIIKTQIELYKKSDFVFVESQRIGVEDFINHFL